MKKRFGLAPIFILLSSLISGEETQVRMGTIRRSASTEKEYDHQPKNLLLLAFQMLLLSALACTHMLFINNAADCAEVGGTWKGSTCYPAGEAELVDGRTSGGSIEEEDGGEQAESEGGSSSDLGEDGIKIVSVETSAPGGACSDARENFDFICKFVIDWTIEYATSTVPAMVVCDIILNSDRSLLRGQSMQEHSGTWTQSSEHSGFFEAMGDYPAQFICELRETGPDGDVVASDEQTIIAPLTTTWEE